MTTALVPGSIGAMAKDSGRSVAESFLSAEVVILMDSSGSMAAADSRGGKPRYVVAGDELAKLQMQMLGKIAVIEFSDDAKLCPGGQTSYPGGSTNLDGALRFARVADGSVRFIVISDGYPDDDQAALDEAAKFTSRIDCIYVGPEGEEGARFLARLAKKRGGQQVTISSAAQLAEITQLMLKSGR